MRPVCLFLVGLITAGSAISSAKTPRPERNFENVIRWVLWCGSSATLQSSVAQALGVEASEVPIHRFRYHEQNETLDHLFVVAVAPFYRRLIVLGSIDPKDGSGTLWSVSPKGRVVVTLAVAGGAVKRISNVEFRGEFAAEKEYFFRKMKSIDGTVPANRHEEDQR